MMTSPKKARVLFVGPYPPPYAGPEVGTKLLLESALKERFRLIHLNTNVRKSNADKGKINATLLAGFVVFVARLKMKIFRHWPTIVYYPITATLIGWVRDSACILISRCFGRKMVIHLRGGHFRIFYEDQNGLVKLWIRFLLNRCELVLVQAAALRKNFQGLVPDEKIKVLYNAIDCADFQMTPIVKTDDRKMRVLFVGHLSFAKGYCDLLKAVPLILMQHPEVVFQFAGTKIKKSSNVFFNQLTGERLINEDPDEVFNEEIASRQLEEKTEYLGIISGETKRSIFHSADIFVLPSYSEGFSLAILEAITAGLAVVTTPVGASAEIVLEGQYGYLVKPGDIHELSKKILFLLNNPEKLVEICRANREYARNSFDIARISGILGDYFDQILS